MDTYTITVQSHYGFQQIFSFSEIETEQLLTRAGLNPTQENIWLAAALANSALSTFDGTSMRTVIEHINENFPTVDLDENIIRRAMKALHDANIITKVGGGATTAYKHNGKMVRVFSTYTR